MCCDNPTDLGCVNSCENITTTIPLTGVSTYTVRFEFNGVEITRTFQSEGVGGFLQIPTWYFNESGPTTFALYDTNGDFVACFKFKVSPKITLPADTVDSTFLNTSIVYVGDSCDGTNSAVRLRIQLSDYDALPDGVSIHLAVVSDNQARFVTYSGSPVHGSGDTTYLTIPDTSALTDSNMDFLLLVPNQNCANPSQIEIRISSFSALNAGILSGTNSYLEFATS